MQCAVFPCFTLKLYKSKNNYAFWRLFHLPPALVTFLQGCPNTCTHLSQPQMHIRTKRSHMAPELRNRIVWQHRAGEGAAPKSPPSLGLLNFKSNICSEESNVEHFGLRFHGANRAPVKFLGVHITMDVFQCRLVRLEGNESYTYREPHLESSELQTEPKIHPPGKASQPRRLRAETATRYALIKSLLITPK